MSGQFYGVFLTLLFLGFILFVTILTKKQLNKEHKIRALNKTEFKKSKEEIKKDKKTKYLILFLFAIFIPLTIISYSTENKITTFLVVIVISIISNILRTKFPEYMAKKQKEHLQKKLK